MAQACRKVDEIRFDFKPCESSRKRPLDRGLSVEAGCVRRSPLHRQPQLPPCPSRALTRRVQIWRTNEAVHINDTEAPMARGIIDPQTLLSHAPAKVEARPARYLKKTNFFRTVAPNCWGHLRARTVLSIH